MASGRLPVALATATRRFPASCGPASQASTTKHSPTHRDRQATASLKGRRGTSAAFVGLWIGRVETDRVDGVLLLHLGVDDPCPVKVSGRLLFESQARGDREVCKSGTWTQRFC